jgi:hypothetical protein
MKKMFLPLFLSLLSVLVIANSSFGQTKKPAAKISQVNSGRAIKITLTPYKNTKIYIGTNYGKNKVLADSCILNEKSEGVFTSKQKLTPGIYFVISPKFTILFDFIVDDGQQFKIIADTLALNKVEIIGSKENELFQAYSKSINELGGQLAAIETNFKNAKTTQDSASFKAAYALKDKEVKENRKAFMEANPNSMMSYLLNVMQRPEAPAIPMVNGKADSLYPFYFVKEHYWDNVVFNDNRLIRTPFFEDKLDEYFKNYVSREPDSIIDEVNYMLTVAKTGKEIYPFLLFKFTNKYIAPEFMGQDKVFLYIYQNFFAKGDTVLLNEASNKSIKERAYSMMANQLGLAAPALIINDLLDKKISLYAIKSPYVFIAFWDPTCGHCKVEVPRLDSIYNASWKALGVTMLGVNTNAKEVALWKTYIKDNKLTGWTHAYQTEADLNKEIQEGKPTTIRQLYDVYKTPTFYLLDSNKKIIAKNLTIEQFNDFLQAANKKGSK